VTSTNRNCPFCGGESRFALTARDRNKEVTAELFNYNRCVVCGTVFLADLPDDLARYYAGNYYGFDSNGNPPAHDNPFLREVEAYRVGLLRKNADGGRLIEVGSGTGGFARAAKESGYDVTAVEMDARCCEYMADHLGVAVEQTDRPAEALAKLPQAHVIAMWHVLEHLPNPAEVLAAAASRLEPGGILAIGVPNPRSLQFRVLGARWTHLDAPRHLCLIPAATLIASSGEMGLEPVTVTTNDPFGRHCNLHGWTYGTLRRPGLGPKATKSQLGALITWAAAPVEHRGQNGSALLMLLRKSPRRHQD
jgi:SAM-dependent methyltransferase